MRSTKTTVILNESLLYGKGTHKKCYMYPNNKNLCIKLPYNNDGKDDILREIDYMRILKKRKKNYEILPQYYGKVETNLGTGYVFEIIQDYNGNKCQTLEDFITSKTLFANNFNLITNMLKNLKKDLYNNEIITMVLFPENILFQKISETEYRIRIVNDMGSSVLIPLEYYISYFAHNKILRRWVKFLNVLKTKYGSPLTEKLIKEIK